MEAFVTLATSDSYAIGAIVWAQSLRNVNTSRQICVMITDSVSNDLRQTLSQHVDHIEVVDVMNSNDTVNLQLLTRPDLGITFTKLHCWRLTIYSKCVFMDADTLVMANIDDLFERDELSAAPDCGWPDCFNSGVFVYKPSLETYQALIQFATQQGSFDGADQGLLNMYFKDWSHADIRKHLPFVYNCVSAAFYSYLPSYKHFKSDIKVAHFIGPVKPWHHNYDVTNQRVQPRHDTQHQADFLQVWWAIYMNSVHSKLNAAEAAAVSQLANLHVSQSADTMDDNERRLSWERGDIDYMGKDRFDAVLSRLNQNIN